MQLTGQNWFTRSLSGGYKMTNVVSLRTEGEAIKESVVRESTAETRSRWARWGWKMAMENEFYKKQCHSDVYIVLFAFPAHFWLVICKSDPCLYYLCVPALTCPLILSRTQHAPNKRCALNNNVHLITRFYGIHIFARLVVQNKVLHTPYH